MSTKTVAVPQADLDELERARVELWRLIDESGLRGDIRLVDGLQTGVTQKMWNLANRNWPVVEAGDE